MDLHIKLANKGYFLEYDTFMREKYNPEKNLWVLIKGMIDEGFENSIIAASDLYQESMWKILSDKGGMPEFFNSIIIKLQNLHINENAIPKFIGGNALNYLNIREGD